MEMTTECVNLVSVKPTRTDHNFSRSECEVEVLT